MTPTKVEKRRRCMVCMFPQTFLSKVICLNKPRNYKARSYKTWRYKGQTTKCKHGVCELSWRPPELLYLSPRKDTSDYDLQQNTLYIMNDDEMPVGAGSPRPPLMMKNNKLKSICYAQRYAT